jgi:hypothetical protein
MTCESESGRRETPALRNGEVKEAGAGEIIKCGLCGGPIGSGPPISYVRKEDRNLDGIRICGVCFLKMVNGVKP